MTRLTVRIDFGYGATLGPGKVNLLELVAQTGSIREAAAGMNMSYRKARLLLKAFKEDVWRAACRERHRSEARGGARRTPLGRFVVVLHALERAASKAGAPSITASAKRLAPPAKT